MGPYQKLKKNHVVSKLENHNLMPKAAEKDYNLIH